MLRRHGPASEVGPTKVMTNNAPRFPRVEDYYQFRPAGDARVSPDGRRVVYVLQRHDAEADAVYTDLWLVPSDGGPGTRLTRGAYRDTAPRWAPDGGRIAFLSDRDGTSGIWLLDIDGGEASRIATEVVPSGPVCWSPDGKELAFTAPSFDPGEDWIPYRGAVPGDRDRARERGPRAAGTAGIRVITRAGYRFEGKGYVGDLRDHIFTVPATPDDAATAVRVTDGPFDHGFPCWSPDGCRLLYTALREPRADLATTMDAWVQDLRTGARQRVIRGMGSITHPSWSPDGRRIAFVGHDGSAGLSTTTGVWVVRADVCTGHFGTPIPLTRDFDRPVGVGGIASDLRHASTGAPMQWEPDGAHLLFLAADRGSAGVYRVRADEQGHVVAVTDHRERVISGFHAAVGVLVGQGGDPRTPEGIYRYPYDGTAIPLSAANDDLLPSLRLAALEPMGYRAGDGWEIEGYLLRHDGGANDAHPTPTVVQVHGGPHAAYGYTFSLGCQLLAAAGFTVLMINPRGSQTYGSEFARAVVGDWGGADMRDILAGVDAMITRGGTDPSRIGIGGWSYGGFMTAWMLGQTDRFRAGIVGAPVTDRISFYGTSDVGVRFGEHHCEGTPWSDPDRLLERSPLAFADRITAPVLLLHGERDLRCPVTQSESLFIALQRLEREAALVVYPDEGHGLRRPSHVVDRYARSTAWFALHLGQGD